MKKRVYDNAADKAIMLHVLSKATSLNVEAEITKRYAKDAFDSYDLVSKLESGGLYIPGTSQSMTWILHYLAGKGNRNLAAWPGSTKSPRSGQDIGALAPTNLSPSRIVTFYEAKAGSRMSLRFKTILRLDPKVLGDESHKTEILQLAALLCGPVFISNTILHRENWVNFDAKDYTLDGQSKWNSLDIKVTYGSNFFDRKTEIWKL